ncbi:reticulon-like protein B1 [Wolffia australiana]
MAGHVEESVHAEEPVASDVEGTCDCLHSSSSDSEDEKFEALATIAEEMIWRFFGRQRPIHHVLGGGRSADIFLWRNKKISSGILASATATWIFLELLQYSLLTLVCYGLILSIAILFLWSNLSGLFRKAPPRIPQFIISENLAQNIALDLRSEINGAVSLLRDAALGRDLRKFISVVGSLLVLSIIGNCFDFLTLLFTAIILLHTLPVLYERYEDIIDGIGEKAMAEIKKQYAKVLSKIPCGISKFKRQ